MRVLRVVSAAILAALVAGVPAGAETQVGAPKESPPAGFTGNQYVDSAGCVFLRAGVGGQTTWVPRVSRDRKLVCGYAPTVVPEAAEAAAEVAAAAEPAPATEPAAKPAAKPADATPVVTEPAVGKPATAAKPVAVAKAKVPAQARKGPVRLVRNGPVAPRATLCLERIDAAQRYLLSDGRRVTHCAEGAPEEPVAYLNGLGAPGLTVAPGAPSAAEARRALRADRGAYRVVWQNGDTAAGPVTGMVAKTATKTGTETAAGPGGYVQVGVFAEPANAAAAIARLKALGLPVASSTGRKGGHAVKAVLAGPFASAADLRAALAAARQAGYPDAYIRG